MQLAIRRSQDTVGVIRKKVVFKLHVQAKVTRAESNLLNKYALDREDRELVFGETDTSLTTGQLLNGTPFYAQHVGELRKIEHEVFEAAANLQRYIEHAEQFDGGETIYDYVMDPDGSTGWRKNEEN